MGILSWLFGRSTEASVSSSGDLFWNGDGDYEFEVVGESYYQDALSAICGGHCEEGHEVECVAMLVPEPSNQYDRNAVAVHINGRKVAHLSREDAVEYHHALRQLSVRSPIKCDAIIVGGWDRGSRGKGSFGVKLDLAIPLSLR